MIIAISGSQCTGKSTLMNELKKDEKFKDFKFKDEIVRTLIKELNIKINDQGDDITQFLVMYNHFKNAINTDKNIITDRCAIDCHVYSTYLYMNNKISKYTMNESTKMVNKLKDKYSLIYYLPPEIELKSDGVRSDSEEFRQNTHNIFLEIFNDFNIPYIELRGSVNQRLMDFKKNYENIV